MRQSLLFQRIAKLVVALLLTTIAGAVYRSYVFAQFVPIRVDVIGAELHSSNHAIEVTLPDLSTLRGQRAVVGLRLRNTRSEERRIGLLREGFPNTRIVLPPERTIRWEIVLSPETVQALASDGGDAARSLELTGDADGWALTALEIRNYHVRLGGDRLMAVALPRHAGTYTTGTGILPVGLALSLLALVTALGPKSQRRSVRAIGNGLALTAFLVCVTCLIVPRISPYKMLLSQAAFGLVAAGLFSPALLVAARQFVVWSPSILQRSASLVVAMSDAISRGFAIVTPYWTRHSVTCERGAAVLALGAISIAQPIFEVVSNSPEFFAARSTTPLSAVAAVLAICFGIPFVLLAIERAIRVVSGRAAATYFGIVLALLSAAVVMPWFRRGDVLMSPWDALISALIGLAVALAYGRIRFVRQFLTALAPAALVVPALFLLDPDVAHTFLPSESAAAVQTIERTPPIVLVVFDELPLNSLLDADGSIDAKRYPNFAALAREAYWFRNASTGVVRDGVGGARDSVRTISNDESCRADAAVLPRQSLYDAGASLRHICLAEIPKPLPAPSVSVQRCDAVRHVLVARVGPWHRVAAHRSAASAHGGAAACCGRLGGVRRAAWGKDDRNPGRPWWGVRAVSVVD